MLILAGDIGGTHTRLLLAECEPNAAPAIVFQEGYPSADYPSFDEILTQFLLDTRSTPRAACFAVAGPVHHGRAQITNLPWQLQAEAIADHFDLSHVMLINDLQGAAHGVATLAKTDIIELQAGDPDPHGVYGVLAAGTGFGQAIAVPYDSGLRVIATEAGHADYAPRQAIEIELLRWLQQHNGRATCEHVLSGAGLINIFEFLQDHSRMQPGAELAAALSDGDLAAAISNAGLKRSDPLAVQALDLFARNLLAYAGNFALNCIPRGGVYLAGGIAPKILARLQEQDCLLTFKNKPPMQALLQTIPLKVVMNEQVGILGALSVAAELACQTQSVSKNELRQS
jgi:glucokinase